MNPLREPASVWSLQDSVLSVKSGRQMLARPSQSLISKRLREACVSECPQRAEGTRGRGWLRLNPASLCEYWGIGFVPCPLLVQLLRSVRALSARCQRVVGSDPAIHKGWIPCGPAELELLDASGSSVKILSGGAELGNDCRQIAPEQLMLEL